MCPWTELRTGAGLMAKDTFHKLVPQLQLADEIDFTGGGESLKHPRILEMIAAAKAAGCVTGFSTNGVMLDDVIARALLDLELDWISFSVDAATPTLYERIRQGARFDTVTANIAHLRDLKKERKLPLPRMMMVFVMMTGAQENFHELPEYVELAHSLGVEQVIAKNLDVIIKDGDDERRLFSHTGESRAPVEAAISAAQIKAEALGMQLRVYDRQPHERVICEHRPDRNLYINWAGNVSPCISLSYAENRVFNGHRVHVPAQIFGNVSQEDILSIWDNPAYIAFRKVYSDRLACERIAAFEAMTGNGSAGELDLPPAPEGCRSCYYLYGI